MNQDEVTYQAPVNYTIGYTKMRNKVHMGKNTMICNSNRHITDIVEPIGIARLLTDVYAFKQRVHGVDYCVKCFKAVA